MLAATVATDAQATLDTLLQQAVARHAVPHVVAVVANQTTVLYRGAVNAAVTDLFRIASMTKPITSVAVMMLQERGLLALDDPLERYLPEYEGRAVLVAFDAANGAMTTRAAAGPLTIRHLLTHTAGFGYEFCNEPLAQLCQATQQAPERLPILHDPGRQWTYGCSTSLLGDVIEQVTGEPFYRFFATQIFQPLGMVDTGYFLKPADQARLAPLYESVAGKWRGASQPRPYEPSLSADGGLLGTADDYIRFLQMLLNLGQVGERQLLSAHAVHAMTRNQIGDLTVTRQPGVRAQLACPFPLGAGIDKFGLGFQLKATPTAGRRAVGSYSWGGIFNTHFWADPTHGIAAVLLTQCLPFYEARVMQLLDDFEAAVYRSRASSSSPLPCSSLRG